MSKFKDIFYTSLSSRFSDKQAMMEMDQDTMKDLTAAAFHRLVSSKTI
jgi:hypothetical protein